ASTPSRRTSAARSRSSTSRAGRSSPPSSLGGSGAEHSSTSTPRRAVSYAEWVLHVALAPPARVTTFGDIWRPHSANAFVPDRAPHRPRASIPHVPVAGL